MRVLAFLLALPFAARAAESASERYEPGSLQRGAEDARPARGEGRPLFPSRALEEDLMVWGADLEQRGAPVDAAHFADWISLEALRAFDVRSLPEAARLVPGVFHSRDMWGEHRLGVRGLRAHPEVAVRVDGLLLNDPYDGRAPAGMILGEGDLSVVRGPEETVRRALAPLGTVEWTPRERAGLAGALWFGSFTELGVVVTGGGEAGPFDLWGEIAARGAEGYVRDVPQDLIASSLRRAGQLADGQPVGRTNDGGWRVDAGGRARWTPAEMGGLAGGLKLRAYQEERGVLVGYFDTAGEGSILNQATLVGELSLALPLGAWKIGARGTGARHQALRHFRIVPENYEVGNILFPQGIVQETEHTTLSYAGELTLEGELFEENTFLAGVGLSREWLASFDFRVTVDKDGRPGPLASIEGIAVPQRDPSLTERTTPFFFIEDRWRVAGPFLVALGLRADAPSDVERTKVRCEELLLGACGSALLLAPRLAAGLDWEGVSFWLRYARDARPPTFEERTAFVGLPREIANGHPEGNSDLRPVQAQMVEARAGYDTSGAGVRARLWLAGFWQRFTDRIETIVDSVSTAYHNRDAGPVTAVGVEGGARLDLSPRAWQEIGFAWSRVTDDGIEGDFNLLTDVPQLSAHVAVRAPLGEALGIGLIIELGSERRSNSRTKLEALHHWRIPAFALLGASLFSERDGTWDVQVAVKNALDQDLRDDPWRADRVKGLVPREGRAMSVTVRGRL